MAATGTTKPLVGHHRFIESATQAVQEAEQVVLPLLMVEFADAPWSTTSLRALVAHRDGFEPIVAAAVRLLEDFELPFVEEEERLADAGVTLAEDLLGFEEAMLEFERAFWLHMYAAYAAEPERWSLPEPVVADVCPAHGVASGAVRAALRDQDFTDFAEAAPYVGADPACPDCRVGVTRLLVAEVKRRKGLEV